jgi:hypothetical protein
MSAEAEDLWHVRVAPDEVKILTLEQVDDLFRLEVIDEDTQLWQEGMDEWLPLRVIAGLDDEPAPSLPPISNPPPRSPALAQTAPWPPPPAPAPPPPSHRPLPPATLPPPRSARPAAPAASSFPAPITATQPISSYPAPIGSTLPKPSRPPPPGSIPVPGATRSNGPAPIGSTLPKPSRPPPPGSIPVQASPASVRPNVGSFMPSAPVAAMAAPYMPRERASRAEFMLIGLAVIAGLGVSLHRNGAIQGALASAGQGAAYENLERSLGGPGFGTPRSVEALVAKTPAVAPALVAALTTTVSPSSPAPEAAPTAAPAAESDAPSGGRPLVAEMTAPAPKPAAASKPAPVRQAAVSRPAAAPAPVRKASKKKSGGNEYDPLNSNL